MKYVLVILPGLARLAAAAACNADNCYRAVAGSAFGTFAQTSRAADCMTWMTSTVTPATSTITVTVSATATSYLPPVRHRHKRTTLTTAATTTTPVIPQYVSTSCTANATPMTARWSSACSCAGVTRGTKTLPTPVVTTTVTATSITDLPMCTNYGLQFAAYQNLNPYDYEPTIYKSETPEASGVVSDIQFSNYANPNTPTSLYGSAPIDTTIFAVTYRGYLIASQNGTYTFSSTLVDDFFSIWLGPNAYSGWNFSNANINADSPPVYYYYGASGPGYTLANNFAFTYTVDLSVGLIPIRFLWANGGGPGAIKLTILAPDGTLIMDPSIPSSKYLITDCSVDNAPVYPVYGSET